MAYRLGLDRFKKAETAEPFDVNALKTQAPQQRQVAAPHLATKAMALPPPPPIPLPMHLAQLAAQFTQPSSLAQTFSAVQVGSPNGAGLLTPAADTAAVTPGSRGALATAVGAGGSQWVPPEWAVDPKPGLFSLEVLKDGKAVDVIVLDKKRTIFGRQAATCDFVLDHPSVSRQHAAVVHHRNGRLYVMDLGSVHGTFVSTERVQKDTPLELEPGQSLRFAASTRVYVLVRSKAPSPSSSTPSSHSAPSQQEAPAQLPDPPDPNDSEGVLAYNTLLNRLGVVKPTEAARQGAAEGGSEGGGSGKDAGEARAETSAERQSDERAGRKRKFEDGAAPSEAPAEREGGGGPRSRSRRVSFRDEHGGELEVVVGFSDGADVATEPGPIGVKEGSSLVGKFDSLVKSTIIPRGAPKLPPSAAPDGRPTTAAAAAAAVAAAGSFIAPSIAADSARGSSGGGGVPGVTDSFKAYLSRVKGGGLYGTMGLGQAGASKGGPFTSSAASLAPPVPWAAKRIDGEYNGREGPEAAAQDLRKGKTKRNSGEASEEGVGPSVEEAAADWSRMPRKRLHSGRIGKEDNGDDDDDDLFGDGGD